MSNISRIEQLLSQMDELTNAQLEQAHQPSNFKAGIGTSLIWSAGMGLFNALKTQRAVYDQYANLISIKKELNEPVPQAKAADQRVNYMEELLAWAKGYEVTPDRTPTADDLLSLAMSDNAPQSLVPDEDELARKANKLQMSAERLKSRLDANQKSEMARRKQMTEESVSFASRDYDGLRRQIDHALNKTFCSDKFDVTFEQGAAIVRKLMVKWKQYYMRSIDGVAESFIEFEEDQHAANARILTKMLKDASEVLRAFEAREDSETHSNFEPGEPDRDETAKGRSGRDKDVVHSGARVEAA